MQRITAKLGNMRKAADWVVYPASRTGESASFDPATGKGLLSKAKPNGAYFMHLSKFMGATEVVVPADVIAAATAARPKSGDEIGPGVTIA